MKKENTKKSNGDISTLICTAILLLTVSDSVESFMIFKYGMLASAVGMLIYAFVLSIKRENAKKEQSNVQESSYNKYD